MIEYNFIINWDLVFYVAFAIFFLICNIFEDSKFWRFFFGANLILSGINLINCIHRL